MGGSILRAYDRLLDVMAAVAAALLVLVALAISLDVVLRNLNFGYGVTGVIELTEYALYAVTILGTPWALRLGAHVAVEIFVEYMPAGTRRVAAVLADLVGLGVAVGLVWAGWLAAGRGLSSGRLVFKTFIFPEWWLLVPLPAMGLFLVIEFLLRLASVRPPPASTTGGH